MSLFLLSNGDGSYALTAAGIVLTVVVLILILILSGFFRKKEKTFSPKQLAFSAIAIALAYVASYIKLLHLPWGGSVTLFSMLFVVMIGYWFGPSVGLAAAFSYGLLQFLQGGTNYILSPMQIAFDYVLAFTALGVSGFFSKFKHGLITGYVVSVFLRGLLHAIGGYLFWMDYMPEDFPEWVMSYLPALYKVCQALHIPVESAYPILYNYAYIGLEAVITLILLSIPAVRKAIEKVTVMARE